jgi:hypothetical protein
MYIPSNTFGYYVFILGIDLEYLSEQTSIALDTLKTYYDNGLSEAAGNDILLLSNALGISVDDFGERYSKNIEKNKPLTKEQKLDIICRLKEKKIDYSNSQ